MSPAEYCSSCPSYFKSMNCCPYPDRSILWVALSLLPMAIAYLAIIVTPFTRRLRHLKVFIMMELAYILSDSFLKKIFKGVRPQGACKTSYGMPSSHMAMLCSLMLLRFKYSPYVWEKVLWAAVLVLEGIARLRLNYHTLAQVITGAAVGVIFFFIFEYAWGLCESAIPNFDEEQHNELNEEIEEPKHQF